MHRTLPGRLHRNGRSRGRACAARAAHYRARYVARNARLVREADEHAAALAARKREIDARDAPAASARDAVAAAIARAQAKKTGRRK